MSRFEVEITFDTMHRVRHTVLDFVTLSIGASHPEHYELVANAMIDLMAREIPEVAAASDEEVRHLTAALAVPAALLITTTLVASYLAEEAAGQTGIVADGLVSCSVARVATRSSA